MASYAYHEARSVQEVLQELSRYGQDARLIAGGTDLLTAIRRKKIAPKVLVGILELPELNGIRPHGDGLWIGAATTHHAIASSDMVRQRFPVLADACGVIGSRQIRNVATIGGNVCNAAVCADSVPALLVIDAVAHVVGPLGERQIGLAALFAGPGHTVLAQDEILLGFEIPPAWSGAPAAYIKHTWRNALDIQMVGAAIALLIEPGTQRCLDAHIALGTAAPTPMRAMKAEALLRGHMLDEEVAREAGRVASDEARPRTSYRATAEYRREMIQVLVRRCMLQALATRDGRL